MAARLILNADDFGLTRGINRAIADLHAAGVLTSATLMAKGPAFDDAVAIAHAHPTLGVGCHVVLVDGEPVSPPDTVPGLLAKHGQRFRTSLVEFFLAVLMGQVGEIEIEREVVAQIRRLQQAGIAVTHIDTHKHTHILPGVARPLLRAAQQCGVHAIRNPFEAPWSLALSHGSLPRRLQVGLTTLLQPHFAALPQIVQRTLRTTDGTTGISATGNLDAVTLSEILQAIPSAGTYELLCHPGYIDADLDTITTRLRTHREIERQALLTEVPKIFSHPNSPQLIHYGSL